MYRSYLLVEQSAWVRIPLCSTILFVFCMPDSFDRSGRQAASVRLRAVCTLLLNCSLHLSVQLSSLRAG
jgi:threonine/homoserine efflux transporter RhtA